MVFGGIVLLEVLFLAVLRLCLLGKKGQPHLGRKEALWPSKEAPLAGRSFSTAFNSADMYPLSQRGEQRFTL